MRVTVIGCGRWGSFISWYLDRNGHSVTLYGRSGSRNMERFLATRSNDFLELGTTIELTTSLECAKEAEIIVISIDSQGLAALLEELRGYGVGGKSIVLCMKGLEIGTGRRLSEIAAQTLPESCRTAVWLGPGHVQEFVKGVPNCMVIDSLDEQLKRDLVDAFSSELIRFYYGADLIGSEIGAAAKNVIGIAAGILDGLNIGTMKGALMSRGTREIARLISALGGNELSAYGLCHLGDYEATVFSEHSHNRRFGELLARGVSYDKLAEGYYTARAITELAERHDVELPICSAVHDVLFGGAGPIERIGELFTRSIKNEF